MTYRQILLSLELGQSITFDTPWKASAVMGVVAKLYGIDRRFSRSGETITRIQ